MPVRSPADPRLAALEEAFTRDGFAVTKVATHNNRLGLLAEHQTAVNYDTGRKKRAFYVEGTGYEMGYLLGSLAEDDVSAMACDFADRVILAFIGVKDPERHKIIGHFLVDLTYSLAKKAFADLPQEIQDEIHGLRDGCLAANKRTRVGWENLVALNLGIDVLCALIYTGDFLLKQIPALRHTELRVPVMCNAFAVFGKRAGGGHYLGRDFMFPSAGIFQDRAAMIVQHPDGGRPMASMTAPGLAGSIAAINIDGVGAGVDMSPGANCDPHQIGVNSLLLVRRCIQRGGDAEGAVDVVRHTPRGVSWNYIIADGANDRACVVEAGCSGQGPNFLAYPPDELQPYLPSQSFLDDHPSAPFAEGIAVRWSDYDYPQEYLAFNPDLWQYHVRSKHRLTLYADAFAAAGYINRSYTEKNCPATSYFAPPRETGNELVLVTNHYLVPEMRLFAMYPWTARIVGEQTDDIQWRYDELNAQIAARTAGSGRIDYEAARELIDYLAPYRGFPMYYEGNPRSGDGKEIRIEGSVSLMDLKRKTIESHYGYYCDPWVKLTLANYIP